MSNTILLALALQHWEQHGALALAARDVAVALARGASKHVHVLSVYAYKSINTHGLPSEVAARYRDEQMQGLDVYLQRKMAAYIAPLEAAGVQVSKLLRVGNTPEVVVQVATEVEADLLIMGTPVKRGILDVVRRGTTWQISKRAPCPVLLVSAQNSPGAIPMERQRRARSDV
jgi:nucleotide-binding universal stress UspA family protein